jgi:hypothetical protein
MQLPTIYELSRVTAHPEGGPRNTTIERADAGRAHRHASLHRRRATAARRAS